MKFLALLSLALCLSILAVDAKYSVSISRAPPTITEGYKKEFGPLQYIRDDRFSKRASVPTYWGLMSGEYYGDIQLAGQTFRLILDTGSWNLFVAGPACSVYAGSSYPCKTLNPYANAPPASDHYLCTYGGCVDNNGNPMCYQGYCATGVVYGDGSWADASNYNLSMTIDTYSAYVFAGLIYNCSLGFGLYGNTQYGDGLIGLGWGGNSLPTGPTPIDSLISAGMPPSFAMYMYQSGGFLTLGGYESQYAVAGFQYLPIVPPSTTGSAYYTLASNPTGWTFTHPTLGSDTVSVTPAIGSFSIVDSGTTLLVLDNEYYAPLLAYLNANCTGCAGFLSGSCSSTPYGPAGFPNLTLNFLDGSSNLVTITLNSLQYAPNLGNDTAPCYTWGISVGNMNINIIGSIVFNAYYVYFDMANTRVGFADLSTVTPPPPSNPPTPISPPVAAPVATPSAPVTPVTPMGSTPVPSPSGSASSISSIFSLVAFLVLVVFLTN